MTDSEKRFQKTLTTLVYILLSICVITVLISLFMTNPSIATSSRETIVNTHREYIYDEFATRMEVNELLNTNRELYFNAIGHFTNITRDAKIAEVILDAALTDSVPVNLAFAIAWQESRFVPTAVNVNGNGTRDNGLWQINEYYHSAVDPLNLEESSFYAMEYLNFQYSRFESWDIAAMLYNAGNVENVSNHSVNYLASVLDKEREYDEQFNKFRRNIGFPNLRD